MPQNTRKFKSKMDASVKTITILYMIAGAGLMYYLFSESSSSYFPAWVTMVIVALLILVSLSIPRYLAITTTSLDIHCLLEITHIPISEIKSITPLSRKQMRSCIPIPLLGIWGIFGYYGYYFNFSKLQMVKLYASHWDHFFAIETIYEDTIIVSNREREEIIGLIEKRSGKSLVATNDMTVENLVVENNEPTTSSEEE